MCIRDRLTDAQKVDMFCAFVVGVEYGTDNVTENELIRFSVCRNSLAVPENPKKGLIQMTPNQMEMLRKWIRVEILYQTTLSDMSKKLDNPADPMTEDDFNSLKEELKKKLKVDSFYAQATCQKYLWKKC